MENYTEAAPEKDGYYWIKNSQGEIVEIAFILQFPMGCWEACCTRAGDVPWNKIVEHGNMRSVEEVTP